MEKYKAYVQANVRRVLCEVDINLSRALDFLAETKDGVIYDSSDKLITKEELEDVKSLRSLPGVGVDSIPSSGRALYEDSYRELFEFTGDNAESSSERDN